MEVGGVQGQTLGRACTPQLRSDNSHSATKTVALLVGDSDRALFRFKHSNKEQTHPRAELAPFLVLVLLRGGGGVLLETTKSCEQGVPSLPHPVLAPGKGCI